MNKKELRDKLVDLFVEYGAVPQGYWFHMYTRDHHHGAKFVLDWEEAFKDIVEQSVDNMLK